MYSQGEYGRWERFLREQGKLTAVKKPETPLDNQQNKFKKLNDDYFLANDKFNTVKNKIKNDFYYSDIFYYALSVLTFGMVSTYLDKYTKYLTDLKSTMGIIVDNKDHNFVDDAVKKMKISIFLKKEEYPIIKEELEKFEIDFNNIISPEA